MTINTTEVWRALLRELEEGAEVSQASMGAAFKGHTSYELVGYQTRVPMDSAVVLCPARQLGYRFLAAEAAWILSGSNRVEEIVPFARQLGTFSDDGVFFDGAYGPPFVEQVGWVARKLQEDPQTRQAVMTIWRPRPGSSKDVPCTVALQWLIRDGALRCCATMRSSDAWTGWPYDVHTFSMMSAYIALLLRGRHAGPVGTVDISLGELTLTCGSQHLYKRDLEAAHACAWTDDVARTDTLFELRPLDLSEFTDPQHLIRHLWNVARSDPIDAGWLRETLR